MHRNAMIEDAQFRAQLIDMIPQLRAVALVLTANDSAANALTHETVLRALGDSGKYLPVANFRTEDFKTWCLQLLHETYAANPRLRLAAGNVALDTAGDCDEAFRKAFWQLSPSNREMLILTRDPKLSLEDIARIRGCSIAQAKRMETRARYALKARFNNATEGAIHQPPARSGRMATPER